MFLLGGTGAIGRRALPALVSAGHEVSALVRTAENSAAVRAQGADREYTRALGEAAGARWGVRGRSIGGVGV